MSAPRRVFQARPRNPVTHRQFLVTARTAAELAALMGQIEAWRQELRMQRQRRADPTLAAQDTSRRESIARQLAQIEHGRVTVDRAARAYAEAARSTETRRRVLSWLAGAAQSIASAELATLSAPLVSAWVARLGERGAASTTIGTHWKTLRAVARYASERGWIVASPWGSYRPTLRRGELLPRREAARSAGELVLLLGAADALDRARRARAPNEYLRIYSFCLGDLTAKIACAALLGLRQRELARLRWTGVDFERQRVRFDAAKRRGVAELAALPELFELLARHKAELERLDLYGLEGPVFVDPRASTPGRPRPYGDRAEVLPRAALRAAVKLAGLPTPERWSAQSLRDTFATLEARAFGGDLATVAARTRHASIASLVRYLRTASREPAEPGFSLTDGSPRVGGRLGP